MARREKKKKTGEKPQQQKPAKVRRLPRVRVRRAPKTHRCCAHCGREVRVNLEGFASWHRGTGRHPRWCLGSRKKIGR